MSERGTFGSPTMDTHKVFVPEDCPGKWLLSRGTPRVSLDVGSGTLQRSDGFSRAISLSEVLLDMQVYGPRSFCVTSVNAHRGNERFTAFGSYYAGFARLKQKALVS